MSTDQGTRRRRSTPAVLRAAVVVGAVAALPATVLSCSVLSIGQDVARGVTLSQAWRAAGMTDEDWEMVPVFLFCAVLLAILSAAVAAVVWVAATDRVPGGPWVARVTAALAAALIPVLWLGLPNFPLAVAGAVPTGLIALVAASRVGYGRRRHDPALIA